MITRSTHRGGTEFSTERTSACATAASSEASSPAGTAPEVRRGSVTRIGVFGDVQETGTPSGPFSGSGAYVAAKRFIYALAAHSRVRRLDLFHSFHARAKAESQFRLDATAVPGRDQPETHFLEEVSIREHLQSGQYDALHEMPTDLARLSYLRSRFSESVFPLTCSQYGISYRFDFFNMFVSMLTVPIYPCDAIVCLSRASRTAHENRMGDIAERYSRAWNQPPPVLPRCEVIPCGIETQRFCPRDQNLARIDLGLPLDKPIVLCLGRIRIQDKMDWTPLLLAFRRTLRATDGSALLVLAGSNPSEYGEQLVAQAQQLGLREAVRTFFNLPHVALPNLYAACDVFVSPADTLTESFGLTIIEAMACGRPVVASDWDSYKDLIEHGRSGFRVRTDWADCLADVDQAGPGITWEQEHTHSGQSVSIDVSEMAAYITELLRNRELRHSMGQRGRQRVEMLYDWSAVIPQWEALWTELADIARSLSRSGHDRMDYMRSNYFQHFSHYASRIIGADTPVRLTETGAEILAGKLPPLLHPWATGFLKEEVLRSALAALRPSSWLRTHLEVNDISRLLRKSHNISEERALMHIMWLAKYDLVELCGAKPALLAAVEG